jgi:hypothetical protein
MSKLTQMTGLNDAYATMFKILILTSIEFLNHHTRAVISTTFDTECLCNQQFLRKKIKS